MINITFKNINVDQKFLFMIFTQRHVDGGHAAVSVE